MFIKGDLLGTEPVKGSLRYYETFFEKDSLKAIETGLLKGLSPNGSCITAKGESSRV